MKLHLASPRARVLLGAGLVVLAIASVGCKRRASSKTDPSATTTVTSASASPGDDAPASAALRELESHLAYGKTWGSDEAAQRIAKAAFKTASDHMIAEPNEVAVAVRAIDAEPRQVIILIKLKDLKEETGGQRKNLLDELRTDLSEGLSQTDVITVGVKGAAFYGAVAQGTRSGYTTKTAGKVVGTSPLHRALATPVTAPSVREAAIGTAVRVGSIEWKVTEVKDAGKTVKGSYKTYKTAGRFVLVHLQATSQSTKPLTASAGARLVDDAGREFNPHPESGELVPDDTRSHEGFELQPDVPADLWIAYELPAGAKGIKVKIRGPLYSVPAFVTTSL